MMRKRWMVTAGAAMLAFSLNLSAAETWTKVSLVDSMCALKVKADPDQHTRACALQCAKGGFGVIAADGTYLKFDARGNEQAAALLKGSKAADTLRVTVTGTQKGDTIAVTQLQLVN
jgi:VCBS repeat-containing protein